MDLGGRQSLIDVHTGCGEIVVTDDVSGGLMSKMVVY